MKILSFVSILLARYLPTIDSSKVRFELSKYPTIHSHNGPLVLCQAVESYTFVLRVIHFLIAYRKIKNQNLHIGWIVLRKPLGVRSYRSKIRSTLLDNKFTDLIWLSLYKSIGGKIAIHLNKDTKAMTKASVRARETQNSLHSKSDLVNFRIENIQVGDLVYDTYLRFKPAATVDIYDPFLGELLEWTWDLYFQTKSYLENHKVTALVTSYTSYIHHGLIARMALERCIPVYSLGARNQLVVQPTVQFPFHVRNFHNYRELLKGSDMKTICEIGTELITRRMTGKIDPATSYMKKSAYNTEIASKIFPITNKKRALVMGHDFYDSPHIYGSMIFADFYEWIEFVFTEARNSEYDFFYKPHPNGLPNNVFITKHLRSKYPNIQFIEKEVSNLQILEEGIDIAFTVYGTVSHEFAFKGVPVVSAGDNPHNAYKFNICARTKEELAQYIHGSKKPILDNSEVPEFCYVHNYRHLNNSLSFFPFLEGNPSMSKSFEFASLDRRIDSMVSAIENCNKL
ncbi:hypothetical protein [Bdellovibrio sp. HCB2-146]|uniref:hypothetical protein n=1 Tax=Bdellovibrio sp. HCB2-146 TaxID=3394362 RepID=UPI0039BC3134